MNIVEIWPFLWFVEEEELHFLRQVKITLMVLQERQEGCKKTIAIEYMCVRDLFGWCFTACILG